MRKLVLALLSFAIAGQSIQCWSTTTLEQRRRSLSIRNMSSGFVDQTTPTIVIRFRRGMRNAADITTPPLLLAAWKDGRVAFHEKTTTGSVTHTLQRPAHEISSILGNLAFEGVFEHEFSAYNYSVPDADSYEFAIVDGKNFLHLYADPSFLEGSAETRFKGHPNALEMQKFVRAIWEGMKPLIHCNPSLR